MGPNVSKQIEAFVVVSGTFILMPSAEPISHSVASGTLLVVASNPPTTSGQRTLARAEHARQILDFDRYEIANIFSQPTYRTSGVSDAGSSPDGWFDARVALMSALDQAAAVLLAYGVSKPAGAAGKHHDEQVAWLEAEVARRSLPVWWVGGAPRHPSRWQRYTYRAHPEEDFQTALIRALARRDDQLQTVKSGERTHDTKSGTSSS